MDNSTKLPAPRINPEHKEFWDAAANGHLVIKACRSCGKSHHYPRAKCPFCHSTDTEWRASNGVGVIHAYAVMRRETPVSIPAYVELEEGILMMTSIVGCQPDDVRIGHPVKVSFADTEEGISVPVFRLS